MPKNSKTPEEKLAEAPTGAKVIGYTFLGIVLVIFAALAVRLVLWVLGIEL